MSRETEARVIVNQYEQLLLSDSDLLFATVQVSADMNQPVTIHLMFEAQDDNGRPTVSAPVAWQDVEIETVRTASEKLIKLIEATDAAARANLARVFPVAPNDRSLNISDVRQLDEPASSASRPRPGR